MKENLALTSDGQQNNTPILTQPKVSKTDKLHELVENLPPEKRALIALRLKKKSQEAPQNQTIPQIKRKGDADSFPLSFAQQRLWFLDQFESNSVVYNMPGAFRLTGVLNLAALEQSFNEIIRRHEVLRTTFSSVNEQPVQVIHPPQPLTLPILDLSELCETEREIEKQRLVTQEAQQPFDLKKGPLLRVILMRFSEQEHIMLVTMHHIVTDGWSLGILIQEFVALYEAFSVGKPSLLPELPIQYADFAVWQRQWLQGKVLETQLAYWQQQLRGSLPILKLPTDRPRPVVQTFRGAEQLLVLPKTLFENIKALCAKSGVTLFMMLLAAFDTLLYWYTGEEDIVVGTDIANRNRTEIEGLIGFFVNQLVLRTDISGDPSFLELLERVREVTLGAYAHQDLPFDKLVETLNPKRTLDRTPLFQVKLILQNTPSSTLALSGLTLDLIEVDNKTAEFDLLLNMMEVEQELTAVLKYNTDLFDANSIIQMLKHFVTLLSHVVSQPDIKISTLMAILSVADRQEFHSTSQQKLIKSKRKFISR